MTSSWIADTARGIADRGGPEGVINRRRGELLKSVPSPSSRVG